MLKRLSSFVVVLSALFVVASFASLAQAQDKKADATGTWKWSTPGRNGGAARESTLKLKQDGEKLTGTMSGRQEIEIQDGKVVDGKVSFKVVRKGQNGQEMTAAYEGKLDGDTIKGTVTAPDRNGASQSRDWEAKREVEKAAK